MRIVALRSHMEETCVVFLFVLPENWVDTFSRFLSIRILGNFWKDFFRNSVPRKSAKTSIGHSATAKIRRKISSFLPFQASKRCPIVTRSKITLSIGLLDSFWRKYDAIPFHILSLKLFNLGWRDLGHKISHRSWFNSFSIAQSHIVWSGLLSAWYRSMQVKQSKNVRYCFSTREKLMDGPQILEIGSCCWSLLFL